jgi:hypothetical protein
MWRVNTGCRRIKSSLDLLSSGREELDIRWFGRNEFCFQVISNGMRFRHSSKQCNPKENLCNNGYEWFEQNNLSCASIYGKFWRAQDLGRLQFSRRNQFWSQKFYAIINDYPLNRPLINLNWKKLGSINLAGRKLNSGRERKDRAHEYCRVNMKERR